MKEITQKDIDEFRQSEEYQKFKKVFDGNDKVIQLEQQAHNLISTFRYVQAQQINQKIRKIEDDAIRNLLKEAEEKVEKVQVATLGLSAEDKERLEVDGVCLGMVADLLETFCMDMNDILKRYDNSLSYEEYYNLIGMLRQSRQHLDWISRHSNLRNINSWGTECDNFIAMIRNKAKKLMKTASKSVSTDK